MRKKLVSDETLKAYKDRFEIMQKHRDTNEGDRLFLSKVTAVSEQIENMHVKAKIGNFEIENDGPKQLGGTSKVPSPMPMFLAIIANCLEITALLYLSFSNLKVISIKVKVDGTHDKRSALDPKKEPFPGFYDIHYTWIIDSDENHKKIERALKKVDEACPVKGTLRSQTFTHEFVYI